MLQYGTVTVDPPLVLAPMAGITDRQFRLILRRIGGVGLVTMEFISSEALTRGNRGSVMAGPPRSRRRVARRGGQDGRLDQVGHHRQPG